MTNSTLVTAVDELDDMQAIYLAQRLAQDFFDESGVSAEEIAQTVDAVGDQAGLGFRLGETEGWAALKLEDAEAGEVARAVLRGWAADPGLAPVVEQGMKEYKTAAADFGIISGAVAIGLLYVLISMDLKVNLGRWGWIKKTGLTGAEQASVVKKTAAPFTRVLGGLG